MRVLLPFILLCSGLVTAHTSNVYQQARRATLGPRRHGKVELAPILARRRAARPAKRSIVYRPGALKIAGFALPIPGKDATNGKRSYPETHQSESGGSSGRNNQSRPAQSQTSAGGLSSPPSKSDKKPKKHGSGAGRRKSSKAKSGAKASASKAATSTSSSSASAVSSGETFTGEATWYTQGGNAGACGTVSQDSDKVVAVNSGVYASGSKCGQLVQITNAAGTTIQAKVMDLCPSCDATHLDLSTGAFDALGDQSAGVLSITWSFVE